MSESASPLNLSFTEAYPSGRKRLRPGAHTRAPGTSILGISETDPRRLNDRHSTALCLTSGIVAAFVSNNTVSIAAMPGLIGEVYAALHNLGSAPSAVGPAPLPLVPVSKSIRPDHVVCLACGHKGKSLKSHLRLVHQLTPDDYRGCFGLPADYPMIAPEYAARLRESALLHGLGRHAGPRAMLAPSVVGPARLPLVPVGKSIRPDHIVCLACGRKGKSLKLHLRLVHQLTPDDYRGRYDLPADYPMVAPEYAERRREIALLYGLGRHAGPRAMSTKTPQGVPFGSQTPAARKA